MAKKRNRRRHSPSRSAVSQAIKQPPASAASKRKKRKKYRRLPLGTLVILAVTAAAVLWFGAPQGYEYVSQKIHHNEDYPRPYREYVQVYAEAYDVPESVIYAVMQTESRFQKDAQSQAGACGLMQLMPDTFHWLQGQLEEHLEDGEIFDVETNIQYGTYYLSWLHEQYVEWETVYAAYNAGPSSVNAWLEQYGQADALEHIPYAETASYVEKVGSAREHYEELYDTPAEN